MSRAVWTPLAELEFEEILYFIRAEGGRPETARRLGEEIRGLLDQHASGHLPGHRHPVAPGQWLYVRHKRWLVFYQPHPEGIEVMRIVDAVRDLPGLFRD